MKARLAATIVLGAGLILPAPAWSAGQAPGPQGGAPPAPAAPAPASAPAGVEAGRQAGPDYSGIPVARLMERLEALDPAAPEAYFRLAEEVAAEVTAGGGGGGAGGAVSGSRAARDLARRLLVLAFHHGRHGQGTVDADLGPSVCLALASLTRRDQERRWLLAMTRVLQEERPLVGEKRARPSPSAQPVPEQVALDLSAAMGLARSAEGRRAEMLLQRPGVLDALKAYDAVLEDEGRVGGSQVVLKAAAEWPACPECRNRRIVTRPDAPGRPLTARLCPVCSGDPGPRLDRTDLLLQLRLESALLRGIHRIWSAQALADGGEPLRDPDPEELAAWYNVDVAESVFRGGRWVKPEAGGAK